MKRDEGLHDRMLVQPFGHATLVAAIANEWDTSEDVAGEELLNWLAGRGEVDGDAKPPLVLVYRDSWMELTTSLAMTGR